MSKSKFLVIVAAASVLLMGNAVASPFTAEQLKAHPCLSNVSMPGSLNLVKQEDLPQGVAPAYIGEWDEPNGSKVCTGFFLVGSKNTLRAIYTVDPRFYHASLSQRQVFWKVDGSTVNMDLGDIVTCASTDGGKTFKLTANSTGKTGLVSAVVPR